MRRALVALLLSAPPPPLVCRPLRAPDVEAPACVSARAVVQPCTGVLVPAADLLAVERRIADLVEAGARLAVDLGECRALRDSDAIGCAEREASVVAERDVARALAAAHEAELGELRGAGGWTLWRGLAVAGAAVVAVAAGWACADSGNPAACFVAGGAAGVVVTLVW